MTITGFSHWSLCVSDLEASVAFYRDVLGCRETGRAVAGSFGGGLDGAPGVRLVRDGQRIELVQPDRASPKRRREAATNDVGLSHLTVATVSAPEVMDALRAKGVRVRAHTLANFVPDDEREGAQFLFEDPDGNLIETYVPGESWNVFPGTAEGDGGPSSCGITHLSHLSLCIADPASALPFYQDVLGWTMLAAMDWEGPGPSQVMDLGPARLTTWLMAAGDQRVELIHFAQPPSPRRAEPTVGHVGLSHLTVFVDDPDSTAKELAADTVRVKATRGGWLVFEDPDGNLIRGMTINVHRLMTTSSGTRRTRR